MLSERNQMYKKLILCDHIYIKHKNKQTQSQCEKLRWVGGWEWWLEGAELGIEGVGPGLFPGLAAGYTGVCNL